MQVACKICGKKIDRDTAYKVKCGKINKYYCNEQEYQEVSKKKKLKDDIYSLIFEIIGNTKNTALFKEVKLWLEVADYEKIRAFLIDKKDTIIWSLNHKNFPSEYSRIRYFSAIVKNSINDFEMPENIVPSAEPEFYESKFAPKRRRKCLDDYD